MYLYQYFKMDTKSNFYGLLDFNSDSGSGSGSDSDSVSEDVLDIVPVVDDHKNNVNSEFLNSESITKGGKKIYSCSFHKKWKWKSQGQEQGQEQWKRQGQWKRQVPEQGQGQGHEQGQGQKKWKSDSKPSQYPIKGGQVFDEMCNLPSSLQDAFHSKQNLTLKQILVLMNLHAMPGMAVNVVHDKIQLKVKKMRIKISHDGRVFHVSYYFWYDLKHIERMIEAMFNTY